MASASPLRRDSSTRARPEQHHRATAVRSTSTLWSRLSRNHLYGNHRSSTLRRTLGSTLAAANGWPDIDEPALTTWMFEHLRVIPVPIADRDSLDELESEVVARLDRPFNLRKASTGEVRQRLPQLRKVYGVRK